MSAAVGEWLTDPKGQVREEISDEWEAAIMRFGDADGQQMQLPSGLDYWLGQILAQDPRRAFVWLRLRIDANQFPYNRREKGALANAVGALNEEHRRLILDELPHKPLNNWLLPLLIGKSLMLFKRLLSRSSLRAYHLRPLQGPPDHQWRDLALAALAEGYEPREIAAASFYPSGQVHDCGEHAWLAWDHAFAALEESDGPGIQEVARYGRELAQERLEQAKTELRAEERFGC
jgi:hypothetical protein